MKNDESLPLIMIGAGGHSRVLADILLQQHRRIVAVACPESLSESPIYRDIVHLSCDADVESYPVDSVRLVNGMGMLPGSSIRKDICHDFLSKGYSFESVIASSAIISPFATLESGVQILPGAIIQTGAHIGAHSIINTRSVVEHDTQIGAYSHIAPGAVLCGDVSIHDNVFIGAGATVIQGKTIGANAVVGAGTCITQSVENSKVLRSRLKQSQ